MKTRVATFLVALVVAAASLASQQAAWLGAPQHIAAGVEFFKATDQSLVEPAGPIAVFLLKLDASKARLASVLSNDEVAGAETVQPIAERHHAVAAINGGFFNVANGEPVSLLKVSGALVSDSTAVKGAVVIRSPARGKTELDFDQLSGRVAMKFKAAGRDAIVPVDGVDTTRARGKLMLYTPEYHSDTDTALNGTEWVLKGRPLQVVEIRPNLGHTPIPRDGVVLSYGGLDLPESLAALTSGVRVSFETTWTALNGLSTKRLDEADHIVNGAGLLRLKGRVITNWEAENLSPQNFINMRHPRTLIGVDRQGAIWLVAIDGRQPQHSVGMSFADLQRLCDRLDLQNALNLDGGGSTTMVVNGKVVNSPSDPTGPRAVSDALLVSVR